MRPRFPPRSKGRRRREEGGRRYQGGSAPDPSSPNAGSDADRRTAAPRTGIRWSTAKILAIALACLSGAASLLILVSGATFTDEQSTGTLTITYLGPTSPPVEQPSTDLGSYVVFGFLQVSLGGGNKDAPAIINGNIGSNGTVNSPGASPNEPDLTMCPNANSVIAMSPRNYVIADRAALGAGGGNSRWSARSSTSTTTPTSGGRTNSRPV